MSEHQVVMFRAIDRPLTEEQLEFMGEQSTRADFTKWEFNVEYHYSSFGGDANEMLRNGYDIFLNYANYGTREIRIRLPNGLPFSKSLWSKYLLEDNVTWDADRKGTGGILTIAPSFEDTSNDIWEFEPVIDDTIKLREMLTMGDLRGLYISWLCCLFDSYIDADTKEPPVPHGIGALAKQLNRLYAFFEIDAVTLEVAATGIPDAKPGTSFPELARSWGKSINASRQSKIIERLLTEDALSLQQELAAEVRKSRTFSEWPYVTTKRTVGDLLEAHEQLNAKEEEKQRRLAEGAAKRQAAKEEKERQTRLATMAKDPQSWIKRAVDTADGRTVPEYEQAAEILADLRDAIGGVEGARLAKTQAERILSKYPSAHRLKSALQKKKLLG